MKIKIAKGDVKQFFRFMLCNQTAYLGDVLVFTLLFEVAGVYYIAAKAASYSVGAFISYTLNRRFTFDKNERFFSGRLLRFFLVNAVSISVSLGSMALIKNALGWHEWFAYLGSTVFSFSANYFGNRFWVFYDRRKKQGGIR